LLRCSSSNEIVSAAPSFCRTPELRHQPNARQMVSRLEHVLALLESAFCGDSSSRSCGTKPHGPNSSRRNLRKDPALSANMTSIIVLRLNVLHKVGIVPDPAMSVYELFGEDARSFQAFDNCTPRALHERCERRI